MLTLNYNIPCFSPPVGYRHKIDANAAWVKSAPFFASTTTTAGRNLLPPSRGNPGPATPWGTPMPIWRPGQDVLVQLYSPDGAWLRGTVVHVLAPLEFESLSTDEIKNMPPSLLEKIMCRYTVQLTEEGNIANVWTEIEEKFLVPTSLGESLQANATQFRVGERVLVQMSDGDKKRTYIGHVSNISGDKVVRYKNSWHVVPRLYKVHIDELGTSGHWTAGSIVKTESPEDEEDVPLLSPLIPGSPLQSTEV